MIIIGIDVGKSGGIAVLNNKEFSTIKIPDNVVEIQDYIEHWKDISNGDIVCYIERQVLRHSDVGGRQFRIIKLLAQFEQLKAMLSFTDIRYVEVMPVVWQKELGVYSKKRQSTTVKKNMFKQLAIKFAKKHKVTLWNADAILIAVYGWKKEKENNHESK